MEEDIKNDLAGIAYTHPYFSEIVGNTLKYILELEEENKRLKIDNLNNLCEECSELTKQAGITEEDTRKILKDYRDKIKNSIPVSLVEEKIEELNKELEEKYSADKISIFSGNTYMEKFKLIGKRQALQEILEEGRK